MKKALLIVLSLLLIFSVSLAEDAVSSATLSVDRLPAVESTGSSILVRSEEHTSELQSQ